MVKNNKGFTLAELIAVIVVLAILLTITVANILPSISSSKKKALYNDAVTMSEAAYNKYLDALLDRSTEIDDIYSHASSTRDGYICYDIRDSLIGKYAKTNNTDLKGTVEVCAHKDCTYKTRVWIKVGDYVVIAKNEKELSNGSYKTVVDSYTNQKTNKCADSTN